MESKPPKSDPLPLLLSEIDILLAQSRLVELYLKQSQAAAVFERQSERERHEAELVNLRAALAQTEQALVAAQQATDARDQSLREEARRLARAIDETRQEIEQHATTLDRAEALNAELRRQLSQSQTAGAEAQALAQQSQAAQRALEGEIIALRARLEDGRRSLQNEQLAARALSEEQQRQILQLQSELSGKIDAAREGENELRLTRSALEIAQARMAELERRREQERVELVREGEQARAQLTDEINHLKGALEEREKSLDEIRRSAGAAEQDRRNELLNLRGEIAERQERFEIHDEQLRLARTEIGALQERASETEKTAAALAQAKDEELTRLRRSHEEELAELRHEVARRERALTERQEAVSGVELALHGKIQALQGELARSRGASTEQESLTQKAQGEIIVLREQLEREKVAASQNLAVQRHADESRRGLEAELARLQQDLAQTKASFVETENQRATLEGGLRSENQRLQAELTEQRSTFEGVSAALARSRAEIAALEAQRVQLERAHEEQKRLRREDALARQELENGLRAKDEELRTLGVHGREQIALALQEQEARFKSAGDEKLREIAELQDRVQGREFAEQQSHAAIVRLRGQIADLEEQRRGLENSSSELRSRLDQANESSSEFEARLQSIESERQKQIADLQNRLDEGNRSHEILSQQLDRLRAEYASAEEEIAGVQAGRREFEQNYQSVVSLREETEARLRAKELELESARADAGTFQQRLDEKITRLQLDLAEKQLLIESRAAENAHLKSELGRATETLVERESAAQALVQSQGELQRLDAEHQVALAALKAERENERQEHDREIENERRRAEEAAQNFRDLEERARQLSLALDERQRELKAAGEEGAEWRARLEQLETRHVELVANTQEAEELRARLETEITTARSELEQKNWTSAQQHAALENLALAHKGQIEKLERRIAEQQHNVRERDEEIERFKSQLRSREERIESLSTELRQTERTAIDRAVEIKEEYGMRIADLERRIAQKDSDLQIRAEAQPELEETLRRELDRLVHEIQERNQILQDRNDELVRVKAEGDTLHERFSAMETAATDAESAFNSETERMRMEFQAQIALLQAEISQKEWADAERQAETRGLEENYRREIDRLREKLAQAESARAGHDDFVFDERPLAGPKDPGASENGVHGTHGHVLSPSRRWQSGFGWKRRWKSS